MNKLSYFVLEKEIGNQNWLPRVLQADYSSGSYRSPANMLFKKEARLLRIEAQSTGEPLDIEKFNQDLLLLVEDVRLAHPEEFQGSPDGFGWYNKKILCLLYTSGLIDLAEISEQDIHEAILAEKLASLEAKEARAEERRERKEEALAKAEEEKLEQARKLVLAESRRQPVVVGMCFSSKVELEKAYREVVTERLRASGVRVTQASRSRETRAMVVVVETEGREWVVTEVLIEGGRKW